MDIQYNIFLGVGVLLGCLLAPSFITWMDKREIKKLQKQYRKERDEHQASLHEKYKKEIAILISALEEEEGMKRLEDEHKEQQARWQQKKDLIKLVEQEKQYQHEKKEM